MRIVHTSIAALLLVTAVSSPAFAQTVVKYMAFSPAPDYIPQLEATIAAF